MADHVLYRGLNTSQILSPDLWKGCPNREELLVGPRAGYEFYEDFSGWPTMTSATTAAATERWNFFGSAGATQQPSAVRGGAFVLTEATDDESVSMNTGATPFQISANTGALWFEACVKFSTITTNEQAWIVGLMDVQTLVVGLPLTTAGAIADVNFVGFHKPEANTTAFDASYKANAVTAVEVNADIGTLAVDTYVKVGMYFDGRTTLSFYVDNVKQTSTKTVPDATGTDFPADVTLGPVIGHMMANSAAETTTVDWVRCVQLR